MKRILSGGILAALAALVMSAAPAAAQAQVKVGFVSSQRILGEAQAVAAAQQVLERELPGLRAPLDTLEQRITAAQQQLQQQGATLSAAVREQRQQELQQQFARYQQQTQAAQQRAQQREQELLAPVLRQINEAIEAVRREAGYSYIVDTTQAGIVAVDPAIDITDRVIQRLGGRAPNAPAPARPQP
jgi:outer membrane protein